ncbi:MFS transporter [Kitasatospora sp. NPDC052896]|uniref:MFS transporter n=1 Tax=Kitasatospora sp. NPDC052896 TaxID=3364061 RepID=UPI0037CA8A3F
MFSSYRRVLAHPGALAFTLGGLVARLGGGMLGISTLNAIAQLRGSYALAGAVAAAGSVGVALWLPLLGRLVDRHGQARVALPAALLGVLPRAGLLLCLGTGAPDWLLLTCAFTASAGPNLGGMARARWAHLHRSDPAARHAAASLEQALDELCFLAGPALGMLLCDTLFPAAGLLAAGVLGTVGTLLFAAQRRTEPPLAVTAAAPRAGSPLRARGGGVLLGAFLATGAVFGALEVSTVAYVSAGPGHGHRAAAGWLLSLLAAGSCLSGLVFGTRPARRAPDVRFRLGLAAMSGLLLLPLAAGRCGAGTGILAVALLLAGTGTAPTMVTGMTLLQDLLPPGTLNEGMALAVSALLTGISAGSALGGLIAQHAAASGTGYALAVTAALLALLTATAGRRRLRASPPSTPRPGTPTSRTPVTGTSTTGMPTAAPERARRRAGWAPETWAGARAGWGG